MYHTKIKAKKDMNNKGRCFTKDKEYTLRIPVSSTPSLMEAIVTNDLNEPHMIGSWWRNFKLV